MIHIWDQKEPWPTKVNFIQDSPMVILGYDMGQNCCERFSWRVEGATLDAEGNLPFHSFDTERAPVEDTPVCLAEFHDDDDLGDKDTYAIRFFLKGEEESIYDPVNRVWSYKKHPDAAIVLTCSHNGYYSHGWELLTVAKEGSL